MLVTYPLSPARRRALARDASSRTWSPLWVVTKRVDLGRLSPAMTALALFSWASSVWLSRVKRLDE